MSSVRIALVLGEGDKEDGDLEVIDVDKIQPLSPNIFLVETKPFLKANLLKNGAANGELFTPEQIRFLLSSLISHPH